MSLPHILLGLLRKGPKSGYELNKDLKTVVHYFWDTDQSRIYRTLSDLHRQGWVNVETVVQTDSPNKKVYTLTGPGRKELLRWLAEPGKRQTETVRNAFLAQLHFSAAIPPEAQRKVLEQHLQTLRAESAELERRVQHLQLPVPLPDDALERGISRDTFSLEYGVRRFAFEIEWTENLIRILAHAEQSSP